MTRHDTEVQRAAARIRAAAFTLVDSGGTEDEAREAFEAGLAEVREMHAGRYTAATAIGSSEERAA